MLLEVQNVAGLMLLEMQNVYRNSGRRTLTRGHQCATWFISGPQLLRHLFLLIQFYVLSVSFKFVFFFFFRLFSFLPFYLPAMKEEIVPSCEYVFR